MFTHKRFFSVSSTPLTRTTATTTTMELSAELAAKLETMEAGVTQQGATVRTLKKSKAPKAEIDAAVAILKKLKGEVEAMKLVMGIKRKKYNIYIRSPQTIERTDGRARNGHPGQCRLESSCYRESKARPCASLMLTR